jgi:hypothetical protein
MRAGGIALAARCRARRFLRRLTPRLLFRRAWAHPRTAYCARCGRAFHGTRDEWLYVESTLREHERGCVGRRTD